MGTSDYIVEETRGNAFHLLILFRRSMLATFDGLFRQLDRIRDLLCFHWYRPFVAWYRMLSR